MVINQPLDFASLVTRIISRGNSLFIEFSITIISFLVSSVTIKYLSMILNFSPSVNFQSSVAKVGSFACFGFALVERQENVPMRVSPFLSGGMTHNVRACCQWPD